jgi:hypothetical protein
LGGGLIEEIFPDNIFLGDEFLMYQFSCDSQRNPGVMCQRLCSPQASIGRTNGTRRGNNFSVPLQHDKRSTLIGQPAKRGESHYSIGANDYQSSQSMPYAGKAGITSLLADSVFNRQVPTVNTNTYSVAGKRYDTMSRNYWNKIAVLKMLR